MDVIPSWLPIVRRRHRRRETRDGGGDRARLVRWHRTMHLETTILPVRPANRTSQVHATSRPPLRTVVAINICACGWWWWWHGVAWRRGRSRRRSRTSQPRASKDVQRHDRRGTRPRDTTRPSAVTPSTTPSPPKHTHTHVDSVRALTILKQAYPGDKLEGASCVQRLDDSRRLQVITHFAFGCVLHRCKSLEIHWYKLLLCYEHVLMINDF